jgi:hypothetical protein
MTQAASVRGEFGGWLQLVTRHGEQIRVEEYSSGMAIIVDAPNGETLARVACSAAGCAELLLSAKERYLAMFLYSGQSEVGYELFYFRPILQHICSFGYVLGEGLGPVFSSDECWLGLAWAINPNLCLLDEGVEHLPNGECLVNWAMLRIQALPDGPATSCSVRVRVGRGFPLEGNESFYPERLEIVNQEARFHTGWDDQIRVAFPLPGSLIIPGPRNR